jgi:coenzyme F420 biosynthesis associated uncharacterized protein
MSVDPFVDWGLAQRVAVGVAGRGGGVSRDFSAAAVESACADAGSLVVEYTRLTPGWALPRPEVVDRAEWTRVGLGTLRELSQGFEDRVASGIKAPGPLGGVARSLAGAAAGAEAGIAVGYGARKVLGQYDLALVGSDREPRLLFVAPNLASTHEQLGERPELFLRWVAIHETTHAVQFTAVPWLRAHLAGLLEQLVQGASSQIDKASLQGLARRLFRTDPRRTIRSLLQGDLARILAGPEQAPVLDRLQAAMSVIEGHAEHVMDAAAAGDEPGYARLRERLEARRAQRGGLGEVISRLLGMELKLRQYRLGKAFCDAVADETGVEGLNRVWSEPAALPSTEELERPALWLERIRAGRLTAAA